jgi:hypothetical protein
LGVPCWNFVPDDARAAILDGLRAGGIAVAPDSSRPPAPQEEAYACRRGPDRLSMAFVPSVPGEVLVALAFPPYSLRPWRWRREHRLFVDVLGVIARHRLDGPEGPG